MDHHQDLFLYKRGYYRIKQYKRFGIFDVIEYIFNGITFNDDTSEIIG